MAILSICPSCQAKLKVPDQMENQKGKCPKCQKMFVVTKCDVVGEAMPNDKEIESPVIPAKKKPQPVKPSATSEVSQVIEPNFQDLEITPRIIQTNVVVNQAVAPTNSLGIASLVVAIMSYFMCWLPGIGVIISGLAVLLGLGGLFMALKRNGTGIGYSIAGVVLAAMSLIITFVWSSAIFQAVEKVANASKEANANIAKPGNEGNGGARGNPKNEMPKNNEIENDLIDASKEPAKFQNIEVKIKSVNKDYVTGVKIQEFITDVKYLKIMLSVNNLSPNRKVDYDGWGKSQLGIGKPDAVLTDNFGNAYKMVHFGIGSRIFGQIKSEAVYPDKPITDLLVFEMPLESIEYLVLDLPAENLGFKGRVKFKIPKEMINLEIKKAQEDLAIMMQKETEAKEKSRLEKEKQMVAKKQADLEALDAKQKAMIASEEKKKKEAEDAEKAKQKAMADIAIDEADRKKKFEDKGLTYYPLPRTVYDGKTADQWYQVAVKIQFEPSQVRQPPVGIINSRPGLNPVDNQKKFQEAINALVALKEEGIPFLLEALQKQTTTQGRALYLQAIKGELIHSNDVPVLLGSLNSNKNQIQTRMIALRTLAKNPGSKKHYEKIRGMVTDLFPNNNVKNEVAELLKAIEN